MKTRLLLFFLLLTVVVIPSFAQLRVTVNLSSRPDPYLSNWAQRKEIAIVTIVNSGPTPVRAKFDCKINQDGQLIANTKPEKMTILDIPTGVSQYYGESLVPFENVKIKNGLDRTAVQTGMLPAGSYEFCCALLDPQNVQISEPVCRNFTLQSYQAPVLLQPEDKSTLAKNQRPMFRWTPVSPKPNFLVLYQIRVFEVLQGQTAINAFRVNKPILEQSNIPVTQFQWPADYDLPNPKLQHIWTVRALDDKGNPIGEPDGYATPFVIEPCCKSRDWSDPCCPPDDLTDKEGGGANAKENKDTTKKSNGTKTGMGKHIDQAQLRTKSQNESDDIVKIAENNVGVNQKEKGKDSTKKDRDFKPMGDHIPDAQLRSKNDSDSLNALENESYNQKAQGTHISDAFGKKPNKKGYDAYAASAKQGYDSYAASAKQGFDSYADRAKSGYDKFKARGNKGYDAYAASAKKEYEEYNANAKKAYEEYLASSKKGYEYYRSIYSEDDPALSKKSYDMYNALAMDKFEDYSKLSKKSYDMYNALATEK